MMAQNKEESKGGGGGKGDGTRAQVRLKVRVRMRAAGGGVAARTPKVKRVKPIVRCCWPDTLTGHYPTPSVWIDFPSFEFRVCQGAPYTPPPPPSCNLPPPS